MADIDQEQLEKKIDAALKSDVPKIYFNGFTNTMSNADVSIILELNGKPISVLNMSYTMAKTLAEKVAKMVSVLEQTTGRPMLTTDQIAEYVKKRDDK